MKQFLLSILIFMGIFGFSQSDIKPVIDNGDVTLSVFPNPATDFINVTIKGNYSDITVKIYSALGSEVFSENIENFKKIDVSDFKNNVYILNVYSKGEIIETSRFVVRH